MKAAVFLGGGRITGALIAGLRLAGDRRAIVVHDRNPGKLRALRREFQVEAARDLKSALLRAEALRAEMLIIAVRPGSVAELLEKIAACGVRMPKLCVSLAAGIPLKELRAGLGRGLIGTGVRGTGVPGAGVRWARAMPSPVCRIGHGLTAVTYERGVSRADRERVRAFFELVGPVVEIPESRFDAFSSAYSPSHGYHALATLAAAAEAAGLDRKTALTAGAHAFAEAILYWRESGQTLAELLSESATPGGTAAATMDAMKRYGYEKAVAAGLRAGIRRARLNERL
ncbi:MAG: pyrroline-5-carboxylate reductase family protein [Candidatus Sulfotelmatobacter sp.]